MIASESRVLHWVTRGLCLLIRMKATLTSQSQSNTARKLAPRRTSHAYFLALLMRFLISIYILIKSTLRQLFVPKRHDYGLQMKNINTLLHVVKKVKE